MNLTIQDLEKIYNDAESIDKDVFAEQRSNILLISGEHYAKKNTRFNERIKSDRNLSEFQKLRLTKNHVHKVHRHYSNQILTYSPGVAITPKNESELQDQKDAELNKSVWLDAKQRYRLKEKIRAWCENYIGIGEVAVKIIWDPMAGELLGYEHKTEAGPMGEPQYLMDEQGRPVADEEKPMFSGDFIFENIYGFNLLIHAGALDAGEADCWIVRKMISTKELEQKYSGDSEKLGFVKNSTDEAFVVFDSTKTGYERTKDQTLLKEYYYKPCYRYPQGYFYIATSNGILEEGELPYGIFPVLYAGFDTPPNSRRARSIIKVARPFQAEINRASSAMATHQITVGDDKIIYQAGTKLAPGSLLPGVRGVTYQGAAPQILNGRDGSQFLPYIQSQIAEMYDVLMMGEEDVEKNNGQIDTYALLYRSVGQQKKYAQYAEKFNQFLVDVCELYLKLAKEYLPDDRVIYAVGRSEQINLVEFRATTKLCYEIKVEEQDETIESKLGKQMTFTNILQYVGKQLPADAVGKIIRAMPFGNTQEAFDDFTIDYDNIKNDMLALERGEFPKPQPYEKHPYIIDKLTHRMKQADFKLLNPKIQNNYQMKVQMHEQLQAINQQKLLAAKSELIPTGGALIACDLYIPNPRDPSGAAKRARIPYQSLDWLVQTLEHQGQSLDKLEQMNGGAQAELAQKMLSTQQQRPASAPPTPSQGVSSFTSGWGGGVATS